MQNSNSDFSKNSNVSKYEKIVFVFFSSTGTLCVGRARIVSQIRIALVVRDYAVGGGIRQRVAVHVVPARRGAVDSVGLIGACGVRWNNGKR